MKFKDRNVFITGALEEFPFGDRAKSHTIFRDFQLLASHNELITVKTTRSKAKKRNKTTETAKQSAIRQAPPHK